MAASRVGIPVLVLFFLCPILCPAPCWAELSEPDGQGYKPVAQFAKEFGLSVEFDRLSRSCTLSSDSCAVTFVLGMACALVNDKKIELAAPVSSVEGEIVVPLDAWDMMGEMPARRQGEAPKTLHLHVVLDPGHGGNDPGAIGPDGVKEKDVNLAVCRRLKGFLEGRGAKVTMTRGGDEFIELEDRAVIASTVGADILVSVHANASPDDGASGFEVFYLPESGKTRGIGGWWSDRTRADKAVVRFNGAFGLRGISEILGLRERRIICQLLCERHRESSRRLAGEICRQLSRTTDDVNRGAKIKDLHVLRESFVPGVLVEVGFLSNPAWEKRLASVGYQDELVGAIGSAIIASFASESGGLMAEAARRSPQARPSLE